MKFLCDRMLGTLSRGLRFLGFDTTFGGEVTDSDLADEAAREGRILLTRDKELAARTGTFYVASDDLDEQILSVLRAFHLTIERPLSRCSLCNGELEEVRRDEIRNPPPDEILQRHTAFWRCLGCRKVYWQGSHWESLEKRIAEWQSLL